MQTLDTLKQAMKNSVTTVTCMGLYNHGKSSLLNVLVDDYEEKTFKVADVRETAKNKKIQIGNVIYVDTPGLNAKEHDDKKVMDVAKESDINIFVHNVNTGEFVAKEVEFLNMIKNHWKNPNEFIERTIFVLSRIDEVSSQEDIKKTIDKMKQQIKEIFGVYSIIAAISSKDYIEGVKNNENELIELSNILAFKSLLNTTIHKEGDKIYQTKQVRLNSHYSQLLDTLTNMHKDNEQKLEEMILKKNRDNEAFNNDIAKIESTLKNMYIQLEEI